MPSTSKLIYVCPECKQESSLKKSAEKLVCRLCGQVYQVKNGVPILISRATKTGRKADKDRLTYNKFYEERLKAGNGWWEEPDDPHLRLRHHHNLNTSRWLTVSLMAKNHSRAKVFLDAGGGEGYVSEKLAQNLGKKSPTIICADLSDTLLADGKRRRKNPRIEFVAADIQNLPLPDNSVDVVFSIETLEHVRELPEYAREVFRVLKPGGHLYFTTPNKRSVNLWLNDQGTVLAYNAVTSVLNAFSSKRRPLAEVGQYGYYEGDEGYEKYQTARSLERILNDAGFKTKHRLFTQWAGEAMFIVARALRLPAGLIRPVVGIVEFFESPLRWTILGERIGFTQIGIYEKTKKLKN